MEVSMKMINHNLAKTVPLKAHKHKPFFKNDRKPMISCQLAMQSDEKTNFYQLLSLTSQNVGFDDIKKAYKSMALQYHPDVCTPLTKEESTRRFIELRKAYETLSDPNSRRVYDYELGLEDPPGTRFGCVEKRKMGDFPRQVWERQLSGLRKRCGERMKTYE